MWCPQPRVLVCVCFQTEVQEQYINNADFRSTVHVALDAAVPIPPDAICQLHQYDNAIWSYGQDSETEWRIYPHINGHLSTPLLVRSMQKVGFCSSRHQHGWIPWCEIIRLAHHLRRPRVYKPSQCSNTFPLLRPGSISPKTPVLKTSFNQSSRDQLYYTHLIIIISVMEVTFNPENMYSNNPDERQKAIESAQDFENIPEGAVKAVVS